MGTRYIDCIMSDSECRKCSLSSREMDCHGNPAHKLAYYRTLRGLSQQQLSSNTGIVRQQIAKYETGERDINTAQAATVRTIARALDVSMEDLLGE